MTVQKCILFNKNLTWRQVCRILRQIMIEILGALIVVAFVVNGVRQWRSKEPTVWDRLRGNHVRRRW
jgi:hypothetical protein